MAQKSSSHGSFGFDPLEGDLKVAHALPEGIEDKWVQAALTVQGKIGNWDMTYAGAYLKRDDETKQDYADYAFFYDSCCGYGEYFYDNDGALIDPSQFIEGSDRYTKQSHELRFTSPAENRWRVTLGAFTQKQEHGIHQEYQVAGLSDDVAVTGNPDTIWLTEQERADKDDALFGELTFDITEKLSVTGGVRFFESDNSLYGFFGYSAVYSGMTGESQCVRATPAIPQRALHQSRQEDQGRRQHQAPEHDLPRHRRRDVVRHLVGGFPSRRHQSQGHAAAVQVGLPDQLRSRLQDHLGQQPACASTARCSRTTGTTSSIRSSAPTA